MGQWDILTKIGGNMEIRKVKRTVRGEIQYDGAGVKLVRVVGRADTEDFDPFLMLDAFDADDPADYIKGFPWHPHRGIETVTYLIKGEIEHGDSLGNKGIIGDGDCQWMTAGGGILHQEMPQASERMLGAQLWVNLPKADKMTDPQYRDITKEMIPVSEEDGATVRVISGKYKDIAGAIEGDYVKVLYLDVKLKPGSQWVLRTEKDDTLFIYTVFGSGSFSEKGEEYGNRQAILFGKGEELYVKAGEDGLRFFLYSGKPLKEPIAWGGPIVMNTREELIKAFDQLDKGTFIKK
jgi:redox-sensitive bicupin YhaK (pirin superfamily)